MPVGVANAEGPWPFAAEGPFLGSVFPVIILIMHIHFELCFCQSFLYGGGQSSFPMEDIVNGSSLYIISQQLVLSEGPFRWGLGGQVVQGHDDNPS